MPTLGVSVVAGGLFHCDPRWSKPHRYLRDYHRIYVPVSGRARFAVGERWTDLVPGRLYFVPGQPSNRQLCGRAMGVHWLHFLPQGPAMAAALARVGRIVSWPEERWRWWRPVYRRIAEQVAGGGPALTASIHAFTLAVIGAVLAEADADPAEADPDRERLAPALALVERRFPARVPVSALAQAARMSPAHFRRRFAAVHGESPRGYLARRRLAAAAALLAADDRPIAAVAAACGYDDPFHFSRAFRRFQRLSPSAYRRARRLAP